MKPKAFFHAPVIFSAVLVGLLVALGGCGGEEPVRSAPARPESFSFLDMGVNTPLTPDLEDRLSDRLGAVAVERRGLLDLAFSDGDFFRLRLPVLAGLNLDLNPPSGERREHDIVALAYRYPGKRTPAFNRVRLVFSGATRRPLVFRIHANQAGGGILTALEEKYGPSPPFTLSDEPSTQYRLWRQNNDVLVVAKSPDRFGKPEYRIAFYFAENLKDLIRAEKEAAAAAERARRQAGKSAF